MFIAVVILDIIRGLGVGEMFIETHRGGLLHKT